jgi:formylglycine-generating enzyme required for sulfatase activity
MSIVWTCSKTSPGQTTPKAGERMVLTIKGMAYPFRWCPPGTFLMGSPENEPERESSETQHQVTLTHGFWMLEMPVSQPMWEGMMGFIPGAFRGKNLPANCVSWDECQTFIQKLNDLKATPSGYRFAMPTESQWEYACRAGTTTPFHFGSALNGDKANCTGRFPYGISTLGKSLDMTSEPGVYPANAWGLYDMHGNVWEWCQDWSGDYPTNPVTDPAGPATGTQRVLRGGSWCSSAGVCRSAFRYSCDPSDSHWVVGFRLALITF